MKRAVVLILVRYIGNTPQLLLLQRRPDDRTNAGWCLPGGKVDVGESNPEALIREVREEINVELVNFNSLFHYVSNFPGRESFLLEVFSSQTGVPIFAYEGDIEFNSKEFVGAKWFEADGLPHRTLLAGNTAEILDEYFRNY